MTPERPDGAPSDTTETNDQRESLQWTVEYPIYVKRTKPVRGDIYIERDSPSLAPGLKIEFGVRLGNKWIHLDRFKNAKRRSKLYIPKTLL